MGRESFRKKRPTGKTERQERLPLESNISRVLGGLPALAEEEDHDLKASADCLDLQNSPDEIKQDIRRTCDRNSNFVSRLNTLWLNPFLYASLPSWGYQPALEFATQPEMPPVQFSSAPEREKNSETPT